MYVDRSCLPVFSVGIRTEKQLVSFSPFALRKTKIVYNCGLSECNRAKKDTFWKFFFLQKGKQDISKLFPFVKNIGKKNTQKNMEVYPLCLKLWFSYRSEIICNTVRV